MCQQTTFHTWSYHITLVNMLYSGRIQYLLSIPGIVANDRCNISHNFTFYFRFQFPMLCCAFHLCNCFYVAFIQHGREVGGQVCGVMIIYWKILACLISVNVFSLLFFLFIMGFIIVIIIIIITELTHSKTILENAVEIEPQPVALDFKNLSQYSSPSK